MEFASIPNNSQNSAPSAHRYRQLISITLLTKSRHERYFVILWMQGYLLPCDVHQSSNKET
jgi:hypothetical protein